MLRRKKDEINMPLPPKTELVVACMLSDLQVPGIAAKGR
jgi:SNF2 family DNA or RNA helicase